MKILVTGAAGFIGHHLARKLVAGGHEVIGLDNFQTGSRDNLVERCVVVNMDVRDLAQPATPERKGSPRSFEKHGFERIYHLACPASPPHYQRDQLDTFLTCVEGTHAVLKAAERWKARVFVASTSEIYGDPTVSPQPEEYRGNVELWGPRSTYDEGKRAGETLSMLYAKQRKVEVRVARIFNTFGEGMALDDGRAVPNFITQALWNEPMTVYGSGLQTRSLCYVGDMVDGIVAMMENPRNDLGPINLGSADEITMKYLAETIRDLCASHSSFEYKPLPVDDPQQRRPSLHKARTLLQWSPKTSLRAGLQMTIADLKERLARKD